MVLHEVFTACIPARYRAPICSSTTSVLALISAIVFIAPFLFAYRTQGFWLKEAHYREQPDVHFKYEYLFIAETDVIESPVVCSSFSDFSDMTIELTRCPNIRVREEDTNKDGLKDIIYFDLEALLPGLESVQSVTLMLLFDYKLTSYSQLTMESVGLVSESWAQGGRSLEVSAELRLHQKSPLRASGTDTRYNESVLGPTSARRRFSLSKLLANYASRNVSTRLENVYAVWRRGRAGGEAFKLSIAISIPEDLVSYAPAVWQVLRLAWAQYLALLVPVWLLGRRAVRFLLDARVLRSVKTLPWVDKDK